MNWRQKLPSIPTVPISAQTRWSVPSAGPPGANAPPATAPRGEPGETMPLGQAQRPVAQKGEEQECCHACLACLPLRSGETWAWFCHSPFWLVCGLPLVWGYLLPERRRSSCQFYSVLYSSMLFPDQSAADTERARTLKEEGNELVKKGNHKKAVEKYSESLKLNQECATYTNRYCSALCPLENPPSDRAV